MIMYYIHLSKTKAVCTPICPWDIFFKIWNLLRQAVFLKNLISTVYILIDTL